MKEINNNTTKDIDYEQHKAILEAAQLLEKAFKKKLFQVSINPDRESTTGDDIWGIAFSFDRWSIK